jgi:outer membrane protein assembly factor BamB
MKRVSLVISILCGCFVSVASTQQSAGTCSNNWTEFHQSNMQRWNPCEKVLNVNNVGKLSLKWQFGNIVGPFLSSPAVANGVVYVGLGDGYLYALNAETGVALWTYAAGGSGSSPAVANGVVYVGSVNGDVYALNARTGAKLWS